MARAIAHCTCEKCGEEFTKIAYKCNRREANSFVEWAENGGITLCSDCYREMIREAERAKNAGALEKYTATIPELTGSEKQIKWAKDLRAEAVKKADDFVELDLDADEGDDVDMARAYITWLIETKTESRFWIDNRGRSLFNLAIAKKFAEEIYAA